MSGKDGGERAEFNLAWYRLQPWPDVIGGMNRLKSRYIVAALSDGNILLLTRMAKHPDFPWDCVLSAELARHYKPDPEVYLTAAEYLDLQPRQVLIPPPTSTTLREPRRWDSAQRSFRGRTNGAAG